MEQTKNEPTKENKAAPETGKPKKEREPLTEAQRLKRQKMIVLPAMVLVFIGAMWLIFAPSSGKEQPPGTDGYNTEMPDADKANRQIIGDKLKAYEHGEMEEREESRNRSIGQLGDMFDREIAGTENGVDFDLANPGGKEERAKPATPQTIQSSAAAYRDLNATLGNFYDQPKNDNAEMDELFKSRKTKCDGCEKRNAIFFAKTKCTPKIPVTIFSVKLSGRNTSVVQTPFENYLNDTFY